MQLSDRAEELLAELGDPSVAGAVYTLELVKVDIGQFVGGSNISVLTGEFRAFLYYGTMQDLGSLGGTFSRAWGINVSVDTRRANASYSIYQI